MSDPTHDEKINSRFRVSRRGFVKMAGTTAAAVGLAKWTPKAFGQSGETAYPGWEIAPTMPPAVNPYQGTGLQALLAYNPGTDPDAKYLRSVVPLAPRAAPLKAIQAKPMLSSLPQCVNESYGEIVMGTQQAPLYRYGAQGNVFAYRFFQYQDIVACIQDNLDTGFDGVTSPPFTGTLPTLAKFLPNAAQIDAAHRNGALALGYIGPNDGSISTGYYFTMQNPDGSYPVGNKMVDLAAYFGFDGWFCDIENTNIDAEDFAPVCLAMKARAKALGMPRFYLLDYDNGVSDTGPVQSGAFDCYSPNYGWSSSTAQNDISQVQSSGLSPFTTLYFGLDISNNGQTDYSQLNSVAPLVIPSDGVAGPPVASIALFTVDAGNGNISSSNTDNANLAASNVYWTNSTGNPALTPASGQNLGIADFITERSAITSFPFVSRFNVGWSSQFFINGSVSNSNPWYSLGIQDILPTWEWWTKDFNSNNIPSGLLSANYDTNAAFNGGSSLQISGNLGANNPTEVRLFKTNLAIPQSSSNYTFSVTYLMVNGSASSLYLGMIFADSPSTVVWVAAPSGVARGSAGWMQSTLNLSSYSGRTIVAISLGFQGSGSGSAYSICIGEIALLNGATYSGAVPSNLTLENSLINSAGTAAQLRLKWDYDPQVWYYDIYRQISGGTMWLGRVSCDCCYVQAMPRIGSESSAIVQLVAIAPDGTTLSSDGSTLSFSWSQAAGPADFTLSCSSHYLSMNQADSVNVTIYPVAVNGFTGTVALSVSGALPSGVTAAFNPTSTTSSSVLTLTTGSSLTAGTYLVTVEGTSGSLTHKTTINLSLSSSADASQITLTASTTAAQAGLPVTLTASVPSGATGSVTFFDGSSSFGTIPLSGTTAVIKTRPSLLAGSYSFTAAYSGDANYGASVSSPVTVNVTGSATPINDTDSGITYTGTSWVYSPNRTGAGDLNADVHYTTNNGDSASYTFTGTGIVFTTETNSDEGNIAVYVDGTLMQTVSAVTSTRFSEQVLYSQTWPTSGTHTIEVVKQSGNYMLVDAFYVLGSMQAGTLQINDTNSGITYAGSSWGYSSNRGYGDYDNDVHYTTNNGDSASYTFSGTGIEFVTEMYSDEGNIAVYIDGVFIQTVSAVASTRQAQQVLYAQTWSSYGTHTIQVVKQSGSYMLVDAFYILGAGQAQSLLINAGGSASGAWAADEDYSGGSLGSTGATINTSKVANPAPQAVYQTERVGSFTYTIPGLTAEANYTVNLHFAEIYWTAAGQRIFSVAINGATVLTNFDVFATAGGEDIAIVETFAATATSSGTIVIAFNPGSADIPKISGIQITQGQPLQINGGGSASGAWADRKSVV